MEWMLYNFIVFFFLMDNSLLVPIEKLTSDQELEEHGVCSSQVGALQTVEHKG